MIYVSIIGFFNNQNLRIYCFVKRWGKSTDSRFSQKFIHEIIVLYNSTTQLLDNKEKINRHLTPVSLKNKEAISRLMICNMTNAWLLGKKRDYEAFSNINSSIIIKVTTYILGNITALFIKNLNFFKLRQFTRSCIE